MADYFDRTKSANRRALERLGHHWPAANASDAGDDDEQRRVADSEELATEPGRPE